MILQRVALSRQRGATNSLFGDWRANPVVTRIQPYQDAYAGAQEQYKRDMAEWSAEQERTAQLSA